MTERPAPEKPLFDRRMLEALVCPLTQSVLSYDVERQELISKAAKLAFPIRGASPSCWPPRRARSIEWGPLVLKRFALLQAGQGA